MRGTFANIRLRNQLAPGRKGVGRRSAGRRRHDDLRRLGEVPRPRRAADDFAGKEYRIGMSRDWAAKGTLLLGVKAVIAESFERIHRSNLVNMGVLPLQFREGESAALTSSPAGRASILSAWPSAQAGGQVKVRAVWRGTVHEIVATVRIDTPEELVAFRHGGILPYVVRQLLRSSMSHGRRPDHLHACRLDLVRGRQGEAAAVGSTCAGFAGGNLSSSAFSASGSTGYPGEMHYRRRRSSVGVTSGSCCRRRARSSYSGRSTTPSGPID